MDLQKRVFYLRKTLYFLRSGRVLERDFFVLCFHIEVFRILLIDLLGFVGPQGARRGPNGSLSGSLRGQI